MTTEQARAIARKHRLEARGFVYPVRTVLAAHDAHLPLSQACALLEKESRKGLNIFGHDSTSSIPNRWKGTSVTLFKYAYYKRRRGKYGMQGVGPCQLTWWATQDEADKEGGCRKPYPNMLVGFRQMHQLVKVYGVERGGARYNGSGPAATIYGRDFAQKTNYWHKLFLKD